MTAAPKRLRWSASHTMLAALVVIWGGLNNADRRLLLDQAKEIQAAPLVSGRGRKRQRKGGAR